MYFIIIFILVYMIYIYMDEHFFFEYLKFENNVVFKSKTIITIPT